MSGPGAFDDVTGEMPPPQDGGRRGRVALVVAGLILLAVVAGFWGRGRIPPELSPTLEHAASQSSRNTEACIACHRFEGSARPRPQGHTPRHDCWNCHALAAGPVRTP